MRMYVCADCFEQGDLDGIAVSAELHKHYVAVGRTIRTVSLRWNVWYVIHCHSCGGVWCVGIRSPSTS